MAGSASDKTLASVGWRVGLSTFTELGIACTFKPVGGQTQDIACGDYAVSAARPLIELKSGWSVWTVALEPHQCQGCLGCRGDSRLPERLVNVGAGLLVKIQCGEGCIEHCSDARLWSGQLVFDPVGGIAAVDGGGIDAGQCHRGIDPGEAGRMITPDERSEAHARIRVTHIDWIQIAAAAFNDGNVGMRRERARRVGPSVIDPHPAGRLAPC